MRGLEKMVRQENKQVKHRIIQYFRTLSAAFLRFARKVVDRPATANYIYFLSDHVEPEQIDDLRCRLEFYVPGSTLVPCTHIPWAVYLSSRPVLLSNPSRNLRRLYRYRGKMLDVNGRTKPNAANHFCKLAEHCAPMEVDIHAVRKRFGAYVASLRARQLERAFVFGTGPSLERAIEMDWSSGYRIVCNTIVRDPELWQHIQPHFIVAGDALYHFSNAEFAHAFRSDLARRLSETQTYFVYPILFHQIVARELKDFSDRLVPIPAGLHNQIHVDLTQDFSLPRMGNVLPQLLLPLACTLSKNVFLWGFDGRAPQDQLFWANSAKHSYPELLPGLQAAFPAFFDHHVPQGNPTKYVEQVHGDVLENSLQAAESTGWSFHMLHNSWTPTLHRRYSPSEVAPTLRGGVRWKSNI